MKSYLILNTTTGQMVKGLNPLELTNTVKEAREFGWLSGVEASEKLEKDYKLTSFKELALSLEGKIKDYEEDTSMRLGNAIQA